MKFMHRDEYYSAGEDDSVNINYAQGDEYYPDGEDDDSVDENYAQG
jgi:hypothetical protein